MPKSAPSAPLPRFPYRRADYDALGEGKNRWEPTEGNLVMVPHPSTRHQRVSRDLGFLLLTQLRSTGAGEILYAPIDVVLREQDREQVVQPDFLVVLSGRRAEVTTERGVEGAPDLVVEIFSPTTALRDRTQKRATYERHGVRELWYVNLEGETTEILSWTERGYVRGGLYGLGDRASSALLEGFEIEVDEVPRPTI